MGSDVSWRYDPEVSVVTARVRAQMEALPLPLELVSLVAGPSWPCGAAQVASWAEHQAACGPCGEVPF